MIFYIYMSTLATMVPPSIVWLVLRRLTENLRNMAARDPLTDLLNRRGLSEVLQQYFKSRHAAPAYLLMMDIDHFKQINDTYGHQAGDDVICHVADLLRSAVRQGDLTGRVGGEEFVAVFFDADSENVMRLAERLRESVESQATRVADTGQLLQCSVTIGISASFYGEHGLEDALRQADSALYKGKAAGRNRIESAHVLQSIPVSNTELAMGHL